MFPSAQVSVGGVIMLRDMSEGGEPEDLIEPLKGNYEDLFCLFGSVGKVSISSDDLRCGIGGHSFPLIM